ncbi:MAG: hypothetical protein Q7K54_06110 [Candidatus Parcubacteria bacterium]|nr:hypothetical protein [Candidatus Parcubacteria bacterium]
MKKLSKKDERRILDRWIQNILEDKRNTIFSVKRHINRHAKQIYTRKPNVWCASMRNLLEMYEAIYKIKSSTSLQIERFNNKYNKNKYRYTPQPSLED